MRLIPHKLTNLYLRWRHGAGCCDCFSYYYYIAPKLAKGIEEFRKYCHGNSTPQGLTVEKWDQILKEMVWAFEHFAYDSFGEYKEADDKRANKGVSLFGKYFRDLWW